MEQQQPIPLDTIVEDPSIVSIQDFQVDIVKEERSKKGWNSFHVFIATFSKFLANVGRRFCYSFIPVLSRYIGVSIHQFTVILAFNEFTCIILPIVGPLGDRIGTGTLVTLYANHDTTGHKRIATIGLVIAGVGIILGGFGAISYGVIFVGLLMSGMGFFTVTPSFQAELGKNVPTDKIGKYTGIMETSWAFSSLIGIPLMAQIFSNISIPAGFFILGSSLIPCAILLAFVFPVSQRVNVTEKILDNTEDKVMPLESITESTIAQTPYAFGKQQEIKRFIDNYKELFSRKDGMLALVFAAGIMFSNTLLFAVYALWFEESFGIDIEGLGWVTTAIGAAELFGSVSTTLVADKIGLAKMVIIVASMGCVSYLTLAFFGNISFITAIATLFFCFITFETTIVISFSVWTKMFPVNTGTFFGMCWLFMGIGRAVAAATAEKIWYITPQVFSFGRIFSVGITSVVICTVSFTCMYIGLRISKKNNIEL